MGSCVGLFCLGTWTRKAGPLIGQHPKPISLPQVEPDEGKLTIPIESDAMLQRAPWRQPDL